METGQLIMITLGAALISFATIYYIIKSATESFTLKCESIRQSLLLESIARQLGVPENEIETIQDRIKKMKSDNSMVLKQEPQKEVA